MTDLIPKEELPARMRELADQIEALSHALRHHYGDDEDFSSFWRAVLKGAEGFRMVAAVWEQERASGRRA